MAHRPSHVARSSRLPPPRQSPRSILRFHLVHSPTVTVATALPPNKRPRILSRLFSRGDDGGVASELAPLVGPIRGELLGAEGLAERAREVARGQRVLPPDARPPRDARGGPLFR